MREEKEAALRDEVNGRNQINAIVTGVSVRPAYQQRKRKDKLTSPSITGKA